MPDLLNSRRAHTEQSLDRQLLASMTLSVFAAAVEVIVGFSVAHWITLTASKTTGYVVSAGAFACCIIAVLLALNVRRKLVPAPDTEPRDGRRLFMARLDLLVAGLVTLLVLAGTLILFVLRPNS